MNNYNYQTINGEIHEINGSGTKKQKGMNYVIDNSIGNSASSVQRKRRQIMHENFTNNNSRGQNRNVN